MTIVSYWASCPTPDLMTTWQHFLFALSQGLTFASRPQLRSKLSYQLLSTPRLGEGHTFAFLLVVGGAGADVGADVGVDVDVDVDAGASSDARVGVDFDASIRADARAGGVTTTNGFFSNGGPNDNFVVLAFCRPGGGIFFIASINVYIYQYGPQIHQQQSHIPSVCLEPSAALMAALPPRVFACSS